MTAQPQHCTRPAGARELIDHLVDGHSFVSWDTTPAIDDRPEPYWLELQEARVRSGADEAVVTGEAVVDGHRVALVVSEFAFLAGSVGMHAAERISRAFRRAAREGLPVIAAPASGGTRMQEGTEAFVTMIDIAAAVDEYRSTGMPYLVYLRHPTTGGVMASWGSLGHITAAEPGALLGFLGPRAYRALRGEDFPEGVQVAENLHAHGLVDAVVAPHELRGFVSRTLSVLCARRSPRPVGVPGTAPGPPPQDAWDAVRATRDPDRPRLPDLLRLGAAAVVPLHGDGEGRTESGIRLALVTLETVSCVVVGQTGSAEDPLGPAALHVVRRGIRLARDLGLPLVTVIDTPGATLSPAAEEDGLAGQIARCLHELLVVPVPTVSVLLGQGTGGAAIALLPANRTVAAASSWLAPLPPEGASGILHRTPDRAPEIARAQGVDVTSLQRLGVVDEVVAEGPDTAQHPAAFCRRITTAIERHLLELLDHPAGPDALVSARTARYSRT